MINRFLSWLYEFKQKKVVIAIFGILLLVLCFFMAINFMVIFIEIVEGKGDIFRNLVIFFITLFGWAMIVAFTNELWWKTFFQMLFYTTAIISIFLFCFCIANIFQFFWVGKEGIDFVLIAIILLVSIPMYFGSRQALKKYNDAK